MGEEVRWSRFINDLSLSVPDKVWVKNLTFDQSAAGAGAPAGGRTRSIGTVTFTGLGFGHDDVAAWFDALAGRRALSTPTSPTRPRPCWGRGRS